VSMRRLVNAYRASRFYFLFNGSDEKAFGRLVMLASAILSSCIALLTSGVFYTGFLIGNDINIVNLGIISFLPFIANCFGVFAPLILERFEKRRVILALARIAYFTINILGMTLLPIFVKDPTQKVIGFAIIVFVSHLINALFTGGYAAWHLNFIPNKVRAEYFSFQQITATTISSAMLLASSFIADALRGTPHQMTIIVALRYIAYALALVEMVILLLPKEYPYPRKVSTISIKNVFVLPFQHPKFLKTMGLIAAWMFFASLAASSFTYYLLNQVGVQYTFINSIDASYALFLIFFSPFWKRILRKWSWLKTFAVTALFHVPTTLVYAFTTKANFVWIMLAVRLTQHFIGVGINLAWANMPYLNLPKEDQSNYIVFYSLVSNFSAFISVSLSTWLISITQGMKFSIFGVPFINVQMLVLLQALGQLLIGLWVLWKQKSLTPEDEE
jgi:hypothetical protein